MDKIKNLTDSELMNLNGGSELTDAIWYGIGFSIGYLKKTLEITYSVNVFRPRL